MKIYQSKIASCLILTIFILSCAGAKPPKPKVMLPPDKYANSKIVEGISVAIIPFDPKRSLYSDPNDPDPNKPDFNWFKAGVCPTRIILTSNSDRSFAVDPAQITCKDVNGTTYKSYDAREAGDAVVASEAFKSYVRGAVAGAILGAAIGAGAGAAMGGAIGGSKWAGRGAAIGATSGGIQGGIMGGGANRASMESRARAILHSNNLTAQLLSKGQTADGVIFLPAVQISSVKIVLAAGANPLIIELPVNLPAQDIPITIKEENPISE